MKPAGVNDAGQGLGVSDRRLGLGLGLAVLLAIAASVMLLRAGSPSSCEEADLLLTLETGGGLGGATPLWWVVGRLLGTVTGDAFTGWQLAAAAGWACLMWVVYGLGVELGLGRAGSLVSVMMLLAWPPLLWRAGMATPEVAGIAAAMAGSLGLLRARHEQRALWPKAMIVAAGCALWPPATWLAVPVVFLVGWQKWRSGNRRSVAIAVAAGIAGSCLVWGGWLLAGGALVSPLAAVVEQKTRGGWLAMIAGEPWLGAVALVLAGWGGLRAWRRGFREVVGLAVAGAGCAVASAVFFSNPARLLQMAPWLVLLAGGLCVGRQPRRCRVVWGVTAAWAGAAALWAWPAIAARLEPSPVWAGLEWVREELAVEHATVVFEPHLTSAVRLLLVPAGIEALASDTPEARALVDSGQGPVHVGSRAVPGGQVLKAWRWTSGRVQRLLPSQEAAFVATRMLRTDPVHASRAWQRSGEGFDLTGEGRVEIEAGAPARVLTLAQASTELTIRVAGSRPFLQPAGSAMGHTLVIVPGAAGTVAAKPVGTRRAQIEKVALDVLTPQWPGLRARSLVPQAAALPGIGGSYWQTDLTVANPHAEPVTVEVLFLPSERANTTVRLLRLTIPAEGSLLQENVLGTGELKQGARTGALVVRAFGCAHAVCGVMVLSRTYNIQGERCDPIGEGLLGRAPEDGLQAGQTAVFEDVSNGTRHRGYVGFASWAASPVRVRATLRGEGGKILGELSEDLAPWSHRHLRLGASCQGATLEVRAEGGDDTLVFPYLSTVDSSRNCSVHRYPDRTEGKAHTRIEPRDPDIESGRSDG